MTDTELLRGSISPRERLRSPKHEVTLTLDQVTKEAIQDYADASGIPFEDAVSAFASRGASTIKQEIRQRLRNR